MMCTLSFPVFLAPLSVHGTSGREAALFGTQRVCLIGVRKMQSFKGRYVGTLSKLSEGKDYGFINAGDIHSCLGGTGVLPTRDVFVHVRMIPELRYLPDELGLAFDIVENHLPGREGKLTADNVDPFYRLIGQLGEFNHRYSYGFLQCQTMTFSPEVREIFPMNEPIHRLPSQNVFMHIDMLNEQDKQACVDGAMFSFIPFLVPSGKAAGKLRASNVRLHVRAS